MKRGSKSFTLGPAWLRRLGRWGGLALLGCQLSGSTRAAAPAPEAQSPDATLPRGDLISPRLVGGGVSVDEIATADLGDSYRRNAGESIRLLRATREAALVLGQEANVTNVVAAAVATGGLRSVSGREFSNLSGGRRIAVVESAEPGRTPDTEPLARVPGVLGVQPVYVDPESRVRMIPTGEVIVGLKEGVGLAEVEPELKAAGLVMVQRVGSPRLNSYLFRQTELSRNSLTVSDRLFDHPKIRFASPNFIREARKYFTPNDPLFPLQQHLHNTGQQAGVVDADVDAVEAWDVSRGVSTVVIAIVDDGVDTAHPELAIYNNPGETGGGKETNGVDDDGNGKVDDYRGWDFANGDNNPNPVGGNGHGTACSGVAAAKINNAYRTAGIAPNCKILPVKIFGDNGIATSDVNIGEAISYAADFADVLSNSWGGGSPSAFIDSAIHDAATLGRGGKGCPVFFATGNDATRWVQGFFAVGSDLGAGTYSFGFRFQKDAATAVGEDLIKIDNVVLMDFDGYTHLPTALGPSGRQDFEGAFPPVGWTLSSSGGPNWFPTTAQAFTGTGGTQSPRSGVTANSGWCELRTPNLTLSGDEILALQIYLSSQINADGLSLRIYNSAGSFLGKYSLISNNKSPIATVSYPARHADAIAVGASTDADRRADYSQYGVEIDFVAPSNGGWNDITTLDPTGAVGYSSADFSTGFGGTSAATPLAAGVGALLLSVNPNLTATEVRNILRTTADTIGPVPYVSGFNTEYGFGRINARAALDAVANPSLTVVDNADGPGRVEIVGTWSSSTTTSGYWAANYLHDGNTGKGTRTVTWIPALSTAGSYEVSVWYTAGSNRASNVPVDVIHASGTNTVVLNERLGGSAWFSLGVFNFDAGTTGRVRMRTTGTDGYVIADAIRWTAQTVSPVVTVAAADSEAGEPSDQGAVTFSRTGSTANSLTVNFTVGGTATSASDYAALGTSITFGPGAAATNLVVTVIDDAVVESTESVVLTLAGGSGYVVGSPASATVNLADNDVLTSYLTVDNTDGPSKVEIVGSWTASGTAPGFWGSDYFHDGNAGKGGKRVTFIPTVGTAGTYEAFIWYTAASNRASNVPVEVIHAGGTTTRTVNQRINGAQWVSLGTYTFNSGTAGRIRVATTATDGYVIADAIRLVPVTSTGYLTVDNADGPSRVELVGAWTTSALAAGFWGTDYLHDGNIGKGTKTATFIPTVASGGTYEVFLWYTAATNRASNLPVDILHAGGTATRTVNQRINGSQWLSLGSYTFNAGTAGRVRFRTTSTDGFVIADAVRLVPTSPALAGGGLADARPVAVAGWSNQASPRISAVRHEGRSATITVDTTVGATLALEASFDLVTWQVLGIRTATEGSLSLEDSDAGGHDQKYYRIRRVTAAE